ncbi:TRAP transporter small permease subunit, partial [Chloroflexota bacterium]
MKFFKKVTTIYDRIVSSLSILGAILIIIAMLIVAIEVVMRYLLHHPQVWVVETTEYILVWFTFLGAAWILKKEGHVKVEIITARLSPRVQAVLGIITSI